MAGVIFANLLLAQAARRRREIAVRLALGVSRARLIRLMLGESLLLAGCGGAAAILMAWWGGTALRKALLPYADWGNEPTLDVRVVGFALLATVVAGVAAGLAPC